MGGIRYAKMGIGVAAVILTVGAIIACFAVYHFFDERDKRRKRRGQ
jgi:hypothetical protein